MARCTPRAGQRPHAQCPDPLRPVANERAGDPRACQDAGRRRRGPPTRSRRARPTSGTTRTGRSRPPRDREDHRAVAPRRSRHGGWAGARRARRWRGAPRRFLLRARPRAPSRAVDPAGRGPATPRVGAGGTPRGRVRRRRHGRRPRAAGYRWPSRSRRAGRAGRIPSLDHLRRRLPDVRPRGGGFALPSADRWRRGASLVILAPARVFNGSLSVRMVGFLWTRLEGGSIIY